MRWKTAQWLEVRWWKNYLRNQDVEDYLLWKREYWNRFFEAIDIPHPSGLRILDAGCGPAGINIVLNGNDVVAIDPLMEDYTEIKHFQQVAWATYKRQDLETFHSDAFDHIYCLNVINHVKNLNASLDALVRHLKPGGKLVMSIDCHTTWFFKGLFRLLPLDILHPHQHDLMKYQHMLERRGLEIERSVCLKPGTLFDYMAIVAEKSR